MSRHGAHVLAALPLLALAGLGPGPLATSALCFTLVTGAAIVTFSVVESSPAAGRWAMVLWLYATPLPALLGEGPSLAVSAGLLLSAAGLAAIRLRSSALVAGAGAALGALLGLALALAASTPWAAITAPDPLGALFSSRRGLLFHWPVLWAGVLGLPLAARRSPRLAAASLGGLAVLLAVSACVPASRPAVGVLVLPFVAPGLVAGLEGVRRATARRPLWALGTVGGLFVLWNLLFMRQYRDEWVPRDDTVSFAQVAEGNARLLAESVGSPPAWPANWLFALRHDLSPARFDLMAGKELPERAAGPELDVGRLDLDDALLAEGWSVRHACGAGICRAIEGRARLFLPLSGAGFAGLGVAAATEGRLGVRVNGRGLGLLRVAPGADAVLPVPADLWRRGLNEVILEAVPGPVLVDRVWVARGGA